MKKLALIISIATLVFFTSCIGVETPRFTKKNPFIVTKVKKFDDENNAYTGGQYVDMVGQFWSYHETIIAPKGLYNVGDTIKVCK
jgi:hypothetical protein